LIIKGVGILFVNQTGWNQDLPEEAVQTASGEVKNQIHNGNMK